jgi:hypothetical protein
MLPFCAKGKCLTMSLVGVLTALCIKYL